MRILVVNAGSSSLKLRLLSGSVVEESADLPADSDGFDISSVRAELSRWPQPDAVGHRIVHGGPDLTRAVVIDEAIERTLRDLVELAPLHQPKSLAGLDAVRAVLPDVQQIACFDTAFHSTLPPEASTYAVPKEWRERWGVRRYGFHGLSHAYVARAAPAAVAVLDASADATALRHVSCHLGAGASLAAVLGGRCVDTTMGFTPLEGLVMATRSGSIDPGLVLWLEEHEQLTPGAVADALEHRSGMLGLTGTADMREVERRMSSGDLDAAAGFAVYVHRLVTAIGSMVVSAGGLDVLTFTGGIGENSPAVRAAVAQRLAFLGVAVDAAVNEAPWGGGAKSAWSSLSSSGAVVRTLVIPAREDLQIAHEVDALLGGDGTIGRHKDPPTPSGTSRA